MRRLFRLLGWVLVGMLLLVAAGWRMALPTTGNTSNIKWFGGVREYRLWGPGYRIYLAQDGAQLIVLFGGGTKRRQQADVARAKELHAEYCARKTATRRGTTPRTKR